MIKNIKQIGLRQSAELKLVSMDDRDDIEDRDSIVYIEGYASVYRKSDGNYQIDRDDELVNTDNLDLTSYIANPVIVWNHDWSVPVGKVTSITKDMYGIYVKGEIHKLEGLESKYEAVKKGLVKSFSIGFVPKDIRLVNDEIVEISTAELVEVSIAPVQSNPAALFTVTGKKSLGISVKDIAEQNNLTNEEIKGMYGEKLKGENMIITKSTDPVSSAVEPKVEPAVTPVEPKVEPAVTPVEPKVEPAVTPVEPKVEPAVAPAVTLPTLDSLSATIAAAVAKAEEAKEAKRLEEEKLKKDAEEQSKLAAEQKVKDALAYIKEQADKISSTEVSQLDFDAIEEFYEAVSTATDAINEKVIALSTLSGSAE